MSISQKDVEDLARELFLDTQLEEVMLMLDQYGQNPGERERERMQLAILKLSTGSMEKLCHYLKMAQTDYRDVLMGAEYSISQEQAKADLESAKEVLRRWGDKKSES